MYFGVSTVVSGPMHTHDVRVHVNSLRIALLTLGAHAHEGYSNHFVCVINVCYVFRYRCKE